jgi:hypothetical protein
MTDGYLTVLAMVNFEPHDEAVKMTAAERWERFRRYELFHEADPNLELFRLVMREISRQWQISIELDLPTIDPFADGAPPYRETISEASRADASWQRFFVLTPFSVDFLAQTAVALQVRRSSSHGGCLIVEAAAELAAKPLDLHGFPVLNVGELLQEFINGLPAEHQVFRSTS